MFSEVTIKDMVRNYQQGQKEQNHELVNRSLVAIIDALYLKKRAASHFRNRQIRSYSRHDTELPFAFNEDDYFSAAIDRLTGEMTGTGGSLSTVQTEEYTPDEISAYLMTAVISAWLTLDQKQTRDKHSRFVSLDHYMETTRTEPVAKSSLPGDRPLEELLDEMQQAIADTGIKGRDYSGARRILEKRARGTRMGVSTSRHVSDISKLPFTRRLEEEVKQSTMDRADEGGFGFKEPGTAKVI